MEQWRTVSVGRIIIVGSETSLLATLRMQIGTATTSDIFQLAIDLIGVAIDDGKEEYSHKGRSLCRRIRRHPSSESNRCLLEALLLLLCLPL